MSNSISKRKQDHLDVCKNESGKIIESRQDCGFESIQFVHCALPELCCDEVCTEIDFLGKKINLPLFISCMTGGSEEGQLANQELAIAAQKMRIPLGLGSMRVLLTDPKRIKDFAMRPYAPDIPIMGNIGAVQLRDSESSSLKDLIRAQDLDALVIHLNCGQELFQDKGDKDFRGLKKTIQMAVETLGIPIIVKETGFGISPFLVQELVSMGVFFVDIAGAGGTNWILVEQNCHEKKNALAQEFANWGNSTAVLVDAAKNYSGKILASGGIRTGMDIAKSLALGAVAAGTALPFIRCALEGGSEKVAEKIADYGSVLKNVMVLTGSRTISEFRKTPLLKSPHFNHLVSSLQNLLV